MGMFDYVHCEYPLPDGHNEAEEYQSKDTPAQGLERYQITADGRLLGRFVERQWVDSDGPFGGFLREVPGTEEWREVSFHGDIRFYCSNVCISGPEGVATRDDRPPVFREYIARFTNGRLEWIKGGILEDLHRGRKHLPREEMRRRLRQKKSSK